MTAAILILLCAAVVRLWGWKAGGLKGWLLAAAFGFALWALVGNPLGSAALAVFVFIWRDLPRNTGGMAIAPENNRVPETLAFNLLLLSPVFVILFALFDVPAAPALVGWGAVSLACTALAYVNHLAEPWAARKPGRDPCIVTDLLCGAGLGVALAYLLLWSASA